MKNNNLSLKHTGLVLFGAISYGILSIFAKFAYDKGFTSNELLVFQTLIGAVILWVMSIFGKQSKRSKVDRKDLINLLLAGIPTALGSVFYYRSLEVIPVSMAILLLFQFVWMGNMVECIKDKRLPTKIEVISIILLLSGTVLAANILYDGLEKLNIKGVIYGLLTAVFYVGFTYINGNLATTVEPKRKSAIIFGSSFVILALFYHPMTLLNVETVAPLFKYALSVALLGAVIPPLCFSVGIPVVGMSMTSILASAELPAGILASNLVLHEKVSAVQWLGVIIILIGIIVPIISSKKKV